MPTAASTSDQRRPITDTKSLYARGTFEPEELIQAGSRSQGRLKSVSRA